VNSLIVNPNDAMLGFTIQPFTANLRSGKTRREPKSQAEALGDSCL